MSFWMTFWQSPWSRVAFFLLGALAWRSGLQLQARVAAHAAKRKAKGAARRPSVTDDYRTATRDDPDAPEAPQKGGVLSGEPDQGDAWVVDLLRAAIQVMSEPRRPSALEAKREERIFTMGYERELELYVYKTAGHKPITSPNFVAFLRRVRAFEAATPPATKKP